MNKVKDVKITAVHILLVDNYDSFTYNLVEYLHHCGARCTVYQNDDAYLESVSSSELNGQYNGILLSPGPHSPHEAGFLLSFIKKIPEGMPVLGVCLGLQALATHFGGQLISAKKPMHGKVSRLQFCAPCPLFENISNDVKVCRYHSLAVDHLPDDLIITSRSEDEHIMSFRHIHRPIYAVQFHPEAILTEAGLDLMNNWVNTVRTFSTNDINV